MTTGKKTLLISAIGVGLQAAGSVCILAAAVLIGKDIHNQVKTALLKELTKQ